MLGRSPAELIDWAAAASVWFVTSGIVAVVGCGAGAGAVVVAAGAVEVAAVVVVAPVEVALTTESVT